MPHFGYLFGTLYKCHFLLFMTDSFFLLLLDLSYDDIALLRIEYMLELVVLASILLFLPLFEVIFLLKARVELNVLVILIVLLVFYFLLLIHDSIR